MRFYERQFTTREEVNKDIIVRFERLLDDYFDSEAPLQEGLPTVKYFADKVFLSANYFGDMIRKQTGQTASEYIQNKLRSNGPKNLCCRPIRRRARLPTAWASNTRST